MSWFTDLLGGVAKDLYEGIPQEVRDIYTQPLPQISAPDITFRPFSVTTSGLGNVGTDAFGGTQLNLSPQQQALQNQLMGQAGQMFGGVNTAGSALNPLQQQSLGFAQQQLQQAGGDPRQRQQDLYAQIRALQTPEEERQRMGLEERLFNQGRLGVQTNQYGGTSEQFALSKAQEEARNAAALSALQQSQAEQQQAANLANTFGGLGSSLAAQQQALQSGQQGMGLAALQGGYAPTANLLNVLSGGMGTAGMADVARRQQGQYDLESNVANLQGLIGQQQGLSNMYGQLYGSVLGTAGNILGGAANSLFDRFF